jgi:hypothetical protein
MFRRRNQSDTGTDAVFIGWQPSPWGGVFPLYTITRADHPARGSTVSDRDLRALNLRIPDSPPPREREIELTHQE